MIILPAIWLLVIGYGLLFVGYQNQSGKPTTFQDAFFGVAKGQLGKEKLGKQTSQVIQGSGSTPVTSGGRLGGPQA